MDNHKPKILLVDDDELNLEVLVELLAEEPYQLVQARAGDEALKILKSAPQGFTAMVLDRMMPGMSGLEVMAQLKKDDRLKWIPVVMQTSASTPREICEGMEAGVFFYLTKPYDQYVLRRIVHAAVEEGRKWKEISRNLVVQPHSFEFLCQGRFQIRTMEEGYELALLLAQFCPDPEKVAFGLNELLTNAVEHGNLAISFEEKSQLQECDQWEEEIQRRLELPEHIHKYVRVDFERHQEGIQIRIIDEGKGFDWKEYEEIKADRLLASHGRGIAMAKALSFDHLEYQGVGNHVLCVIKAPSCPASELPGSFDNEPDQTVCSDSLRQQPHPILSE